MKEFLWISEEDVISLMGMPEAIRALEKGLLAEAEGKAQNMLKTHVAWDGSTLHAIGATFPGLGFAGTKTWAHTKRGATPLVVLFDARDGSLCSIIEAFAMGQMRTGAASALATRQLAPEGAEEMAIIGTGKQAFPQVVAVLSVRAIRRVRVFGRNPDRRARFAQLLRDRLQVEVLETGELEKAVRGTPIVTTATRAEMPFLEGSMLAPGTHVNSIGAIVPSRAEVAPSVLQRCDVIAVDEKDQARRLSRELIDFCGEDEEKWSRVKRLCEILASRSLRPEGADLTLFKSLGMGISDLSLCIDLDKLARSKGLGRPLPHPEKKPLLFNPAPAGGRD